MGCLFLIFFCQTPLPCAPALCKTVLPLLLFYLLTSHSVPTDPQEGFFFDCRVCFYSSYFPPFPPPLPHYLAYSFYGSVPGKCQAWLSLLSGPRRCQPPMSRGARWALPVFFLVPLFFLGLTCPCSITCLFKFRRDDIELIVFMEEWQSDMRAMPACCNFSHTATHYGRVIAYRGGREGWRRKGATSSYLPH